jgi:hypothetical protein
MKDLIRRDAMVLYFILAQMKVYLELIQERKVQCEAKEGIFKNPATPKKKKRNRRLFMKYNHAVHMQ